MAVRSVDGSKLRPNREYNHFEFANSAHQLASGGRPCYLLVVREVFAVAAAFGLCSCGPGEVDITLSGTVAYDAYSSGTIRMSVVEDSTKSCDVFSCSGRTPGERVAESSLDRPGSFSLHATVQESDSDIAVHLLAYLLSGGTDVLDCEAGAMQSFSAASHGGIQLVLMAGQCPMLL